jgi:glycopeptide antibiotics resistance protein
MPNRAEAALEILSRHPIRTRQVVAVGLVLALATGALWVTFTQTYHLTNLYAHLGLYGSPVRPSRSISHVDAYPAARVHDVNHTVEDVGNVVLLAPLGLLLPLLWSGTKLRHVFVVALVGSTLIELGQWALTPNRIAQWSDIAANTAGAMAVFLLVAPIRWLYRRRTARLRPPPAGAAAPGTSAT